MKIVKNMRFVDVKDFIHLGGTTDEIVKKFSQLVTAGFIDTHNINTITIKYDTRVGDVQKGPVRIYCLDGMVICLNLTAGYSGSGPRALCEVLDICNISYNKEDILENKDVVDIKYSTDSNMCYQFCHSDGTFEYSF